ncbi:CBS domain-containing protein [Arenibaculum pallidiluteum]|uniref:CBS domain-containing protein n=1 Tax=Arenibaculum pallidiluteum TaxID=2812559 RepID=UPI001A9564FA|nr:CBS domain-containing protein [Arenibaculum pallidiluteum]
MKVREVMTESVETVAPDTALSEAARMMRDLDTGFLPVGENDRLVGTLTDRDIAIRAVAEGKDLGSATVRDAMSDHVRWVYEDQDTAEAAQVMADHQIRRLAVLNRDKRLVGVLSQGDIATRSSEDDLLGQTVEQISRKGD